MRSVVFLMPLIFHSLFSLGQYPGYSLLGNTESFREIIKKTTSATESIQSDFSQEKTMTMLSEKIFSSGRFWFKKSNRLRMEYIKPYSYLIILNDSKIYIKDDQHENKVSTHSNKIFQQVNGILLDCMSGTMLENQDFRSRIFEGKNAFLIEFTPLAKNLKELYKNINIVVDKKDYSASSVEMVENAGNKTIIRFLNKVINAPIPDAVFNIP